MEGLLGRNPPPARKGLREWYDAYTYHGRFSLVDRDYKRAKANIFEACRQAKDKCWETQWFIDFYRPDTEFEHDATHWIENDAGTGLGYFLVYYVGRQDFSSRRPVNPRYEECLEIASGKGYGPACYMLWNGHVRDRDILVKAWEWGDRDALYQYPTCVLGIYGVGDKKSPHREWVLACRRVSSDLGHYSASIFVHSDAISDASKHGKVERAMSAVTVLRNRFHDVGAYGLSEYEQIHAIVSPLNEAYWGAFRYHSPEGEEDDKGDSEDEEEEEEDDDALEKDACIQATFIFGEFFENCADENLVPHHSHYAWTVPRCINRARRVYRECCSSAREAAITWCLIAKTIPATIINKDIRGRIAREIWKERVTWPIMLDDNTDERVLEPPTKKQRE